MIHTSMPCPCGKSKSHQLKAYKECCYRFISGALVAKTPEQLMRSRYSAYAVGGEGEYLLKTWFPITARGLTAQQLSTQTRHWTKLEVLNRSQDGDEGVVEFKAYYTELNTEPDQNPQVLHEVSEFRRVAGKWFYVGGRVSG